MSTALTIRHTATPTTPVQMVCDWQTLIGPLASAIAGPEAQDAATITNPETEITRVTRLNIGADLASSGTNIAVRLGYDASLTITTPCKIAIFGRVSNTAGGTTTVGAWMRLTNAQGDNYALFSQSSSDVSDGTRKWTQVNRNTHVFDKQGCNEFKAGVETALAGAGTVNTSTVVFKMY